MKDNGTDRDLALKMVAAASAINTALGNIVSSEYDFLIEEQPSDITVADGSLAFFTVKARGVKSYKWQYYAAGTYRDMFSSAVGANTPTTVFIANSSRAGYTYRCQLTDYSNVVHNTDNVHLTLS